MRAKTSHEKSPLKFDFNCFLCTTILHRIPSWDFFHILVAPLLLFLWYHLSGCCFSSSCSVSSDQPSKYLLIQTEYLFVKSRTMQHYELESAYTNSHTLKLKFATWCKPFVFQPGYIIQKCITVCLIYKKFCLTITLLNIWNDE